MKTMVEGIGLPFVRDEAGRNDEDAHELERVLVREYVGMDVKKRWEERTLAKVSAKGTPRQANLPIPMVAVVVREFV